VRTHTKYSAKIAPGVALSVPKRVLQILSPILRA